MKINNTLSLCLLAFAVTLALNACYYDVEEKLYPSSSGCDTSNVTFSAKIKPILSQNCSKCHGQSNFMTLGAGINLETYAGLKTQVDNGRLIKSIKHESPASPMPKGSSATIAACEIAQIVSWVNAGAKDN